MDYLKVIEKQDFNTLPANNIPTLFAEMYEKYNMDANIEGAYLMQILSDSKASKLRSVIDTPEGKRSLASALYHAASNGLSANPMSKEFSLAPFGSKVVIFPQYQGKMKILRRDFKIKDIIIDVVIEGEEVNEITKDHLAVGYAHKKKLFRNITEENLIGGYYVVKLPDGRIICDTLSKEKILRAKSAAATTAIWKSDFDSMAKKTVVHRAFDDVRKRAELPEDIALRLSEIAMQEIIEDVPESDVQVMENETIEVEANEPEELSLVEFAESIGFDVSDFAESENDSDLIVAIIETFTEKKAFSNFTKTYAEEIKQYEAAKSAANAKFLSLNPKKK